MSVVGLVSYLKTVEGPKWLVPFVVLGFIGMMMLYVIISLLDPFMFLNEELFILVPTAICTLIFLPILWFLLEDILIKKIIAFLFVGSYAVISFYAIIFSILFFYIKFSAEQQVVTSCIRVVEYIDYNTHKEFVGSTLVINYYGMTHEVIIPQIEAEKMNGVMPDFVTIKLSKSALNGFYVHEVIW